MTDASLLNLATLALAAATLALVLVTGWSTRTLVREGREGRRQDRIERHQSLVRAAVAEGIDNSRAWFAVQPRRLTLGEKQQEVPVLRFAAVSALIDQVDLPPDVVAYLLWARGFASDLRDRYARCIVGKEGAQPVNECRGLWDATIDVIQTVPLLVRAHAAGDPDLVSAMAGFASDRWLVAQERPAHTREHEHASRMAMEGAPPWPSGERFAAFSPAARDAEGARSGERSRRDLTEHLVRASTTVIPS